MPTTIAAPTDWRFSVSDYHRMAEAGILKDGDRCELIDGSVIALGPIVPPHAGCVNRLNLLLVEGLKRRAVVQAQNPVVLDDYSEPQPDFSVLHARADYYSSKTAQPADVHWLIEVMDSSAAYDRGRKLPLYAASGVPEVWLIDLGREQVEVYSRPTGGEYAESRILTRGQSVSPEAFPDFVLTVDDILG